MEMLRAQRILVVDDEPPLVELVLGKGSRSSRPSTGRQQSRRQHEH
jgi:hypothetical protein